MSYFREKNKKKTSLDHQTFVAMALSPPPAVDAVAVALSPEPRFVQLRAGRLTAKREKLGLVIAWDFCWVSWQTSRFMMK